MLSNIDYYKYIKLIREIITIYVNFLVIIMDYKIISLLTEIFMAAPLVPNLNWHYILIVSLPY